MNIYASFTTMLRMQDEMNAMIHPDWVSQQFAWHRAGWVECAEILDDHLAWKWWKAEQSNIEQIRLEVVDIWHFGMSAMFRKNRSIVEIADCLLESYDRHEHEKRSWPQQDGSDESIALATEAMAAAFLTTRDFMPLTFWPLMESVGLTVESLYARYVGKNVLNRLRSAHGYKNGEYVKVWNGREDNDHLVEIAASLSPSDEDYPSQLYAALEERYATI